ncbi:MAG: ferritin family protein [Candidatus Omnitrophica bacterium]|nr:ferritin family protein [Candidatus Omnitrophota bacterium]MBU4473365.1 ferritin family protein [Candidatus Omnitrophota bacterium]MCG2706493.1 ferritin family protein [Candidatus Omnitrophota bacterium]
MGNIFSGSEVVELGIQIEKNGRDFYNVLVNKSKNLKAQEIFQYLAKEEERHIAVFQNIVNKTQKYEPQGLDADTYFDYMNNLASGYVFTQKDKGAEAAKNTKSDLEAIELGMGFEKDSINFYEGMKKIVPPYELKIVEELIVQEQNHLSKLSDLKKNL